MAYGYDTWLFSLVNLCGRMLYEWALYAGAVMQVPCGEDAWHCFGNG